MVRAQPVPVKKVERSTPPKRQPTQEDLLIVVRMSEPLDVPGPGGTLAERDLNRRLGLGPESRRGHPAFTVGPVAVHRDLVQGRHGARHLREQVAEAREQLPVAVAVAGYDGLQGALDVFGQEGRPEVIIQALELGLGI